MNHQLMSAKYQDATISSLTKAEQIVMVYEAAIANVKQGIDAIEANNISERFTYIQKTIDIMIFMQTVLDHDNAPEISGILYAYYSGIITNLFSIHKTEDVALCHKVIEDLGIMLESWKDAGKQVAEEEANGMNLADSNGVSISKNHDASHSQATADDNSNTQHFPENADHSNSDVVASNNNQGNQGMAYGSVSMSNAESAHNFDFCS